MNDSETAWAAGLFEGEGSICEDKSRNWFYLSMAMIDRDVVEKFHKIVGVGQIGIQSNSNTNPKANDAIRWRCTRSPDIVYVLKAFLPHFGIRRSAMAERAIESMSNRRTWTRKRLDAQPDRAILDSS
jgi:hypothetical protein